MNVAGLIVALTLSQSGGQPSYQDLYKRVSPAVATIYLQNSAHETSATATAFLITSDHVVTNHHVIAGQGSARVVFSSGLEAEVEGVLGDDPIHDVAVLQLKTAIAAAPPTLHTALPEVGERILLIGSPRGLESTLSEGIVSGIRDDPELGLVIQTSAATSPGSSGSPVINMNGEVVGVHSSALRFAEAVKLAIPIRYVLDLKLGPAMPMANLAPAPDRSKDHPIPPESFAVLPSVAFASIDVPNVLERLHPDDKSLIVALSKWYIKLPDGSCADAYGALRSLEVLGSQRRSNSDQSATALQLDGGSGDETVSVENAPGWMEGAGDALLCTRYSRYGHGSVDFGPTVAPGIYVGAIRRGEARDKCVLRVSPPESKPSDEPVLLWPLGSVTGAGEALPAYEVIPISACRAEPADLASALVTGKAQLVKHTYSRNSYRPSHTESTGTDFGLGSSRTVFDGPAQVTFKWTHARLPIAPLLPIRSGGAVPPASDHHAVPIATDRLVMRDGRVFHGRVVSDSGTNVVFVVVVGSIESTMTFPRSDVGEVHRGN
jgi:hypothetical protein